jgi:cysteine-rich repeat protein
MKIITFFLSAFIFALLLVPQALVLAQSTNQCGDGLVQYGEQCDDGNTTNGDECSSTCQSAEVQINTTTLNDQDHPDIAMNNAGDVVIVWEDDGADGNDHGVFAQRYDSLGNARGSEFQVNQTTAVFQEDHAVSMAANGDFVVAWESDNIDGSGDAAMFRLYDKDGVALTPEIQANVTTSGSQDDIDVDMNSVGQFVVAWESPSDGSGDGSYVRKFDAAGVALTGEIQANTTTASSQDDVTVAINDLGGFVVAWEDSSADGNDDGIFAQLFDAAGATVGTQFQVNTYTSLDQSEPDAEMDSVGNFVIAWTSEDQDGSQNGVYAQRYTSTGTTIGSEFQVHTNTLYGQQDVKLDMNSNGDFIIGWQSYDVDGAGNFASFIQQYASTGAKLGPEVQLNDYVTNDQKETAIAMNNTLSYVIAWTSNGQDGSSDTVMAKFFGPYDRPVCGDNTLQYPEQCDDGGTVGGDGCSSICKAEEIPVNTTLLGKQTFPHLAASDTHVFITWDAETGDGDQGAIYARRFSSVDGSPLGAEFLVNTTTAGEQQAPDIDMNDSGVTVVAWVSIGQDGDQEGVFAQRFDANGNFAGAEFQVNTSTVGRQSGVELAVFNDGSFVIAWEDANAIDGSFDGVFAQRYSLSGVPLGGEFQVNTTTLNDQDDISMNTNGKDVFVVVWEDDTKDGNGEGIAGQLFNKNGTTIGAEFLVNTYTSGDQSSPSVDMSNTGEFVVSWKSQLNQDASGEGIYAQRFDANGNKICFTGEALGACPEDANTVNGVSPEVQITTQASRDQGGAETELSANGDIMVTFESIDHDGDDDGNFYNIYNSFGAPYGTETLINEVVTADSQDNAEGEFVGNKIFLVWQNDVFVSPNRDDIFMKVVNFVSSSPIVLDSNLGSRRRGEYNNQAPSLFLGTKKGAEREAQSLYQVLLHAAAVDTDLLDVDSFIQLYQESSGAEEIRSFSEEKELVERLPKSKKNVLKVLDLLTQMRQLYGFMQDDESQLLKKYQNISEKFRKEFLKRKFLHAVAESYLSSRKNHIEDSDEMFTLPVDIEKAVSLGFGQVCYDSSAIRYMKELDRKDSKNWYHRYKDKARDWTKAVLKEQSGIDEDFVDWFKIDDLIKDPLKAYYQFVFGFCLPDVLKTASQS